MAGSLSPGVTGGPGVPVRRTEAESTEKDRGVVAGAVAEKVQMVRVMERPRQTAVREEGVGRRRDERRPTARRRREVDVDDDCGRPGAIGLDLDILFVDGECITTLVDQDAHTAAAGDLPWSRGPRRKRWRSDLRLFGGRESGRHALFAGSIVTGKDIALVVEVGQNHDRCPQSRSGAIDSQANRLVDEILGRRRRNTRAPPE